MIYVNQMMPHVGDGFTTEGIRTYQVTWIYSLAITYLLFGDGDKMGWFKHICHECNLAFHRSVDYVFHRQEHINRPSNLDREREEYNR
jgi:hypothetical protein